MPRLPDHRVLLEALVEVGHGRQIIDIVATFRHLDREIFLLLFLQELFVEFRHRALPFPFSEIGLIIMLELLLFRLGIGIIFSAQLIFQPCHQIIRQSADFVRPGQILCLFQ